MTTTKIDLIPNTQPYYEDRCATEGSALISELAQRALPGGAAGEAVSSLASKAAELSSEQRLMLALKKQASKDPQIQEILDPTTLCAMASWFKDLPDGYTEDAFIEDVALATHLFSLSQDYSYISIKQLWLLIKYIRLEVPKLEWREGERVKILRSKDTKLARSLLVFREGDSYILLNQETRQDTTIGEGGFSKVKLGLDPKRIRRVAISTTQTDEQKFKITKMGYEIASRIPDGAGVAKPILLFEKMSKRKWRGFDGRKFGVIMKFIDGTTLDKASQLHEDEQTAVARDLLKGLILIHSSGVIHCDIKDNNIMLDQQKHPYLIDLGLAASQDKDGFGDHYGGTPKFQAPQLLSQETRVHPKHDIFALGCVFWNLWSEDVKEYLAWESADKRWEAFAKEAPDSKEALKAYAAHRMSEEGWMITPEKRLKRQTDAQAGKSEARKALLIAKMLSPSLEDRPTAQQALDLLSGI